MPKRCVVCEPGCQHSGALLDLMCAHGRSGFFAHFPQTGDTQTGLHR